MSDHKNPTDPLEQLFKKKAEEYDISFREEDWNSLAHNLDLQDAHISYRRKVTLLAAASFMIVALLGYFTFENHNRLNELNDQLSNAIPSEIPPAEVLPPLVDENESRETEPANDGNREPEEPNPERLTQSTLIVAQTEDEPEGKSEIQFADGQLLPVTQPFLAESFAGQGRTAPPPAVFDEIDLSGGISSPEMNSPPHRSSMSDIETHSNTWALSRISVGLLASPDLSTVGSFSNFEGTGYKLGAVVEYSIHKNLSVSAGLVQTSVKYSAHSDHYHAPVYWQNGVSPEQVYAECLLFDIPISLKYNVANFDRSRFFITAGLSSYIMQNEDYYFSYSQYTPGQIESWSGQTGTRHWFSNAGFSIGYELDIHPQWNLRFEPFIKVPIREVGWGNVKLYSVGSFVSLNYRL